jgi:hypothetical protein
MRAMTAAGAPHLKPRRMASRAAALTAMTLLLLGGCGATDPYIYKPREFDRRAPDFNKPITDRREVTLCYTAIGTTDRTLLRMAEEECARFGKRAEARSETFGPCPLLTPIAATFACVAPPAVEAVSETP